jgi:hypothetical protein
MKNRYAIPRDPYKSPCHSTVMQARQTFDRVASGPLRPLRSISLGTGAPRLFISMNGPDAPSRLAGNEILR